MRVEAIGYIAYQNTFLPIDCTPYFWLSDVYESFQSTGLPQGAAADRSVFFEFMESGNA